MLADARSLNFSAAQRQKRKYLISAMNIKSCARINFFGEFFSSIRPNPLCSHSSFSQHICTKNSLELVFAVMKSCPQRDPASWTKGMIIDGLYVHGHMIDAKGDVSCLCLTFRNLSLCQFF